MGLIKWVLEVDGFSTIWLTRENGEKNTKNQFLWIGEKSGEKKFRGEETIFQFFLKLISNFLKFHF